jgi:hypothetical protein
MTMRNIQLECVPSWRFCNIKKGEKVPYQNNWQNTPLTLQDIWSENVGVILGAASFGLCSIDVDGPEALDHFNTLFPNINIADLDTVMWTSGKPYRFQAAFRVPNDYWIVLKRKVENKLEFRWGGQSVVPPSIHPEGMPYIWLKSPDKYPVMDLPNEILVYWLELIYEEISKYDNVQPYDSNKLSLGSEIVDELLSRISSKVGTLKGDYDVWRTIAWATCSEVGISEAKRLMLKYWHYKTNKELQTLVSWKPRGDTPKVGTLIKLSGITKQEMYELQVKYKKIKEPSIKSLIYQFNRN